MGWDEGITVGVIHKDAPAGAARRELLSRETKVDRGLLRGRGILRSSQARSSKKFG
jgi:hypothetical protein